MSVPFGGASYDHIPEITRYQIAKRLSELRPDLAQRIQMLDDGLSMIIQLATF